MKKVDYIGLLRDLGWEFVQTGPEEFEWVKFDRHGRRFAVQGDTFWFHDLKIIGMDGQR